MDQTKDNIPESSDSGNPTSNLVAEKKGRFIVKNVNNQICY